MGWFQLALRQRPGSWPGTCAGGQDYANGPAGSAPVVDHSGLSADQQFESGLTRNGVRSAPPSAANTVSTFISPTNLCPANVASRRIPDIFRPAEWLSEWRSACSAKRQSGPTRLSDILTRPVRRSVISAINCFLSEERVRSLHGKPYLRLLWRCLIVGCCRRHALRRRSRT